MADEEDSASAMATSSPRPVDSIEVDQSVKDEDAGDDVGDTIEHDPTHDIGSGEAQVTPEQYKAMKTICDTLTNYKVKTKGDEDYYPSILFRRVPNKRNLPDYYQIIKEPSALSTLKAKITQKKYTGIPEFVRDFALIVHNAQVYNRPNSGPVRDVLELQNIFVEELRKLVEEGLVAEDETAFPDLGPIPDATPEPDPVSEEEDEGEDEGEEDDEEEDGDDSDDDKRKRRGRRGARTSLAGRKHARDEDDEGGKGNEADPRKRRGRPPRVDTPMEARIKAILKGIRKPKDTAGNLKILHFERLPDKQAFPDYFQEIKEPIAVDLIKRKSKRKKYQSLEHFMRDVDLLFDNAMQYNEDNSAIYKDAADLKEEAHKLLEIEKAKPDDEYMMEDGRLPLPNGILYKNELWKVGDWVHIQNPNDVTKPIVAQIYRTWQDPEGQKWINACWYYRPEQTVHQYEKHFYPNEVVKTGQYRDHQIEEIIDRCFVMFFTRYNRGRPRNLDPEKEVYVCEARYNEEKHKLNKIKTWASCLPDEVREKDYEMDLFDAPRKIKKVPSPILHLLKDETKETDELPQPEWGHPNAPPRVGAIHRQPRDENQSPPPEPTPPPPPTPPPQPVRAPSNTMLPHSQSRVSLDQQAGASTGLQAQPTRPSPSMQPQISNSYQAGSVSTAPPYGRQLPYQQPAATHPYAAGVPQTPAQHQTVSYTAQQQLHPTPSLSAAHPTSYSGATTQVYGRPPIAPSQAPLYNAYPAGNLPAPRPFETYVLSDNANAALPKGVRDQFPKDDQGRVLFFTTPPVDTRGFAEKRGECEADEPLAHSTAYLVARAEKVKKLAERKKIPAGHEARSDFVYHPLKRSFFEGEDRGGDGRLKVNSQASAEMAAAKLHATYKAAKDAGISIHAKPVAETAGMYKKARLAEIAAEVAAMHKNAKQGQQLTLTKRLEEMLAESVVFWTQQTSEGTKDFYKNRYGDQWKEYMSVDQIRQAEWRKEWDEGKNREDEQKRKMMAPPEYMTDISRDPWKGTYLDDYDPRYGF